MKEAFTFDDVLIVQQFLEEEIGRAAVDTSIKRRGFPVLKLPIISSNMDTVTGPKMADAMRRGGGLGCLHRFCTISENCEMLKESGPALVSIGLGDHELERAMALRSVGAWGFVIDVSHGAQMSVVHQANALRKRLGHNVTIVVGNFAGSRALARFLQLAPHVDGVKIGVGPGSACTTRIKTGVGYPQLSAIMEAAEVVEGKGIAVIADGGIKKAGDVAKAIGAGADFVMLGGMLAGTEEAPGETFYQLQSGLIPVIPEWKHLEDPAQWVGGKVVKVKKYRGSASQESYEAQGKVGDHRTAEGEAFMVPYKGSVGTILKDIEGGLRSAITLSGATSISQFQARCEFVRISSATVVENSAHGRQS